MFVYLCSVLVSALLAKATGFSSWNKSVLRLTFDAST